MTPTNRFTRAAVALTLLIGLSVANSAPSDDLELQATLSKITSNNSMIRAQVASARQRTSQDIGICGSTNFTVMCTSTELSSREVLAKAESMRKEIATELLGAKLPDGQEFAIIHVTISQESDEGLTRLSTTKEQGPHRIWIKSSSQRALGSTLAHEIAHIVLNGNFQVRMPAWANEGLASLYDDPERHARRSEILSEFVQSGHWPSIAGLLSVQYFAPTDERAYAISVSLTQFLLSLGTPRELMRFIELGMNRGWNHALETAYGIHGSEALQIRWQEWLTRKATQPRYTTHSVTKDGGSRI